LGLTLTSCDFMYDCMAGMDWLGMLSTHLTADSIIIWAAFSDVLQAAINLCVPVKYMRNNENAKCTQKHSGGSLVESAAYGV